MGNKFWIMYIWIIRSVLFFLPDIPVFMRFRGFLYSFGMKECGKDFQVAHNVVIRNVTQLSVGNNCYIANFSMILGSNPITLENEVMIGPHVIVVSGNHAMVNNSYRYGKGKKGLIKIGNGCWITANCTVGLNSVLPAGSILAANSFINKKFQNQNAVYGGTPAKFIKYA